jgi:hypothetical protein
VTTVFHTVTWIESPTTIGMTLGLEGAIAKREDAERVVEAMREYAALTRKPAESIRIGILEIPAPDEAMIEAANMAHVVVCNDVEPIIEVIRKKIARRLQTTPISGANDGHV